MNNLIVFLHGYCEENNSGYCIYYPNKEYNYKCEKFNKEPLNRRRACIYGLMNFFDNKEIINKYSEIIIYINSNYCIKSLTEEKIVEEDIISNLYKNYKNVKNKINFLFINKDLRENSFVNNNYNISKRLCFLMFDMSNLKIDFSSEIKEVDKTFIKINKKKKRKKKIKVITDNTGI